MKIIITLVSLALFTVSCSSVGPAAKVFNERRVEESRALTKATSDSLAAQPTDRRDKYTMLAYDMSKQNELVIGSPTNPINVGPLLSTNDTEKAEAVALLRERFEEQQKLIGQIRELEVKLQDMGTKYETERNRSIVRRIWTWALSVFGVGGLVALCIFCPAVLPIIGTIISWLVGKIPSLVSWFGVVGKGAFDSVVKGVGEFRDVLKKAPDDRRYTASEVQAMLDNHLKTETDKADKVLINSRREALNV